MALFCFLLPGGHSGPCRVSISPEEPTVEFGTSLVFNCTSSCRNYSRLSWEVPITKMGTEGPGWVSLSIPKVTVWSLELQCFGNFGEQRDIAVTTLRAYRFSPPKIYLEGDTVAGKEARVTCNVSVQVPPPGPPKSPPDVVGRGAPPQHHPRSLHPVGFHGAAGAARPGGDVRGRLTARAPYGQCQHRGHAVGLRCPPRCPGVGTAHPSSPPVTTSR
ncbi:intercellular adhesion molecule 4 [Sarcoramphus papa]